MKVQDLSEKLAYEALYMPNGGAEISDGYTSDLLSDVMANAPEGRSAYYHTGPQEYCCSLRPCRNPGHCSV